jgi:uncharacterized membrane protein
MKDWLVTAFLSLLPISELRGGIPYAIASGIPWYLAWPFAAAVNALVAPLCWLFLSTVHAFFYSFSRRHGDTETKGFIWYRSLFDKIVLRARAKVQDGVEKWGAFGIAIFVAIPLPMTGAWTGTLGAWVLNLSRRKTMLAVIFGVVVAGGIVTAVMTLGISALDFFLKKI